MNGASGVFFFFLKIPFRVWMGFWIFFRGCGSLWARDEESEYSRWRWSCLDEIEMMNGNMSLFRLVDSCWGWWNRYIILCTRKFVYYYKLVGRNLPFSNQNTHHVFELLIKLRKMR